MEFLKWMMNFIRLQLNEPQTEKETEIPSSLNTTLDEYPLPDPLLFQADELEKNYGYMEGDLLPVGRERATNMLNQDFTVYAIVDGGSAEMVFDWTDMDERPLDTMYAISKEVTFVRVAITEWLMDEHRLPADVNTVLPVCRTVRTMPSISPMGRPIATLATVTDMLLSKTS